MVGKKISYNLGDNLLSYAIDVQDKKITMDHLNQGDIDKIIERSIKDDNLDKFIEMVIFARDKKKVYSNAIKKYDEVPETQKGITHRIVNKLYSSEHHSTKGISEMYMRDDVYNCLIMQKDKMLLFLCYTLELVDHTERNPSTSSKFNKISDITEAFSQKEIIDPLNNEYNKMIFSHDLNDNLERFCYFSNDLTSHLIELMNVMSKYEGKNLRYVLHAINSAINYSENTEDSWQIAMKRLKRSDNANKINSTKNAQKLILKIAHAKKK
ncbi:hypothetical protein ACFL1H_03520 [Nanoarchaeota archaeon]